MLHKRYQLENLDLAHLTSDQLDKLVTDSLAKMQQFVTEHSEEVPLVKGAHTLNTHLQGFEDSLRTVSKSKVADKLVAADEARDKAYAILKQFLQANGQIAEEDIQTAYGKIAEQFNQFKNVATKTYEEESAALTQLIKKLKSADFKESVKKLGLENHLARLTQAQEQFETLYQTRLEETKAKTKSQTKLLKAELVNSYDSLADYIAVNAYHHTDKPHLKALLTDINAIRSRYKKRKTSKKAGATQPEEDK